MVMWDQDEDDDDDGLLMVRHGDADEEGECDGYVATFADYHDVMDSSVDKDCDKCTDQDEFDDCSDGSSVRRNCRFQCSDMPSCDPIMIHRDLKTQNLVLQVFAAVLHHLSWGG